MAAATSHALTRNRVASASIISAFRRTLEKRATGVQVIGGVFYPGLLGHGEMIDQGRDDGVEEICAVLEMTRANLGKRGEGRSFWLAEGVIGKACSRFLFTTYS